MLLILYIRKISDKDDSGRGFDVSFMGWEEYKKILLSGPNAINDWKRLIEYDCIIGGIDLNMGYLWVIFILQGTLKAMMSNRDMG